jgi:hypothetical protein
MTTKKDDTNVITSTLTVSIPTYTEKYLDKKNVVFYNIEVYNNYSKIKWPLEKRYSQFEDLREALAKLLSGVSTLPGKSFFKVSSIDALNKRKISLELFLRDCVTRKDIMTNETFREFIEIDKHSPELSANGPQKLSEFSEFPLGIRDFIYLKCHNIMLLACADMNIASRIDAYITNVNLPWEKKSDAHISVGALFAYKLTQDSKNENYFEKLWAKSFPKQVIIK